MIETWKDAKAFREARRAALQAQWDKLADGTDPQHANDKWTEATREGSVAVDVLRTLIQDALLKHRKVDELWPRTFTRHLPNDEGTERYIEFLAAARQLDEIAAALRKTADWLNDVIEAANQTPTMPNDKEV